MSNVGQKERETQNRVVAHFSERLDVRVRRQPGGPGQHQHRRGAASSEPARAQDRRGTRQSRHPAALTAASLGSGQSLYDANRKVYDLLRYGVKVKQRRRRELRDGLAHRLGRPGREPLRRRRGGHDQGRAHQAPGHRALRQRHRAGRHRAQALVRQRQRGHPPEHRQPEADLRAAVLHDGAAAVRRQRRRGPALRASSTLRRSTGWSGRRRRPASLAPTSPTRSTGPSRRCAPRSASSS